MKFLFWLALFIETIALGWFLRQAWLFTKADAVGDYHDPYRKVLFPAAVLGVIVIGALLARFVFHSPKVSLYIAFLPVIAIGVSMIGMMIATIFVGGKWH